MVKSAFLTNLKIKIRFGILVLFISLIVIFVLHSVLCSNIASNTDFGIIVEILNLISIIQLFLLSLSIKKQAGSFNFMNAWVLFAYLFYFGQFYCYPYIFDSRWSLFNGSRDNHLVIVSFFYSLESITIIVLFYMVAFDKYKMKNITMNCGEKKLVLLNTATRQLAKIIVIICVIPAIGFKIYAAYLGRTYGYAFMKTYTGSGMQGWIKYVSYFVGWLMPACYMLILASTKRLERYLATGIIVLYAVLVLISGSRYETLEIVCAYVLILKFYYKKTKKEMLSYVLIISIGIVLVFTMNRFARESRVSGYSLSMNAVLYSVFGDSAPAASINYAVIEYENRLNDYMLGRSYFNGVASVLISPIRKVLFPDIFLEIGGKFSQYLGVTTTSLGSSLIAEAFFNFGWASLILVMPLVGVLMGRLVSSQHMFYSSNIPCYRLSMYIFLCTLLVFAVRSDLASIIRTYIVYALFPALLIHIFVAIKEMRIR